MTDLEDRNTTLNKLNVWTAADESEAWSSAGFGVEKV